MAICVSQAAHRIHIGDAYPHTDAAAESINCDEFGRRPCALSGGSSLWSYLSKLRHG